LAAAPSIHAPMRGRQVFAFAPRAQGSAGTAALVSEPGASYSRRMYRLLPVIVLAFAACAFDVGPEPGTPDAEDAGWSPDADASGAAVDSGAPDAAVEPDAGFIEADAGEDAGQEPDAGWDAGEPDAGPADAGEVCDRRPSPTEWIPCRGDGFVPDSPTEEWRQTTTSLFVVTQGAPRHRGIDAIVNPGQEQILIGKFAYGRADKDLKDEKVEIWIEVACGSWARIGVDYTSDEGDHGTVGGVEDDGGRIFFTIPEDRRLPVGSYRVKMLVKGDHSEANFWLHVWEPGMRVVVSDIDGTITTRENDGLWTVFDPMSPTAREGANDTFRIYAAKGYRVIFLTARPDFITEGTRSWFDRNSFPVGVFHLSQRTIGEHGADAQAYKTAYLESLVENHGVVVEWAYGNKETDLDAYLAVGVVPDHIQLVAGEYTGDLRGSTMIDSYVPESERVACLPPVEQ
jgi:phosphatidate phosphatase PAH1